MDYGFKTKIRNGVFHGKPSYGLLGLISHFLVSKMSRKILFVITTLVIGLTWASNASNAPENLVLYGGMLRSYTSQCVWWSIAFAVIPTVVYNMKRGELFTGYDVPVCVGWFLINFYTLQTIIFIIVGSECSKAYDYEGIGAIGAYFLLLLIPLVAGDLYSFIFRDSYPFNHIICAAIAIVLLIVFLNVRPNKPDELWEYVDSKDSVSVSVSKGSEAPTKTETQYKFDFLFSVYNSGSVGVEKMTGKIVIKDTMTGESISKRVSLNESLTPGESTSVNEYVRIPVKEAVATAFYEGTSSFTYSFELEQVEFDGGVKIKSDYFNKLYAGTKTLTLGSTEYGEKGKRTFVFECASTDYYEIHFGDDIESIEVTYNGEEKDPTTKYKSSRGYAEYYFYSGEAYKITVESDSSYSIWLEY